MKIVFLIPSLRTGGAERVFSNLLSLWDHSADELHLILVRREGPYLEGLPPQVRVHDLGGRRFLLGLPRLIALIRRLDPDAVLGTQAHINAALGFLKPWLRCRRVVGRETSLPSMADKVKKNSRGRQAVYRAGYRRLDAVICPSQTIAAELAERYGIRSGRLPVVPNPLLIPSLRQAAAGSLSDFPVMEVSSRSWIAAVGRFDPAKGYDDLLRAMALLPPSVGLVLIGDGPLREDLQRLAAELALTDRVLWAGFQTNPHRFLSRCRVFALSSRYEGLPNAALEALALGIPVVSFDGSWGARNLVEEGVNGLLARVGDPADFARALRAALEKEWNTAAIAERALAGFDGPAVVRRYREVLE